MIIKLAILLLVVEMLALVSRYVFLRSYFQLEKWFGGKEKS